MVKSDSSHGKSILDVLTYHVETLAPCKGRDMCYHRGVEVLQDPAEPYVTERRTSFSILCNDLKLCLRSRNVASYATVFFFVFPARFTKANVSSGGLSRKTTTGGTLAKSYHADGGCARFLSLASWS